MSYNNVRKTIKMKANVSITTLYYLQ